MMAEALKNRTIGILLGGLSAEREISLQTGSVAVK